MSQDEPFEGFPHMDPPEVPEPKKTIPGSIGCLSGFLAALVLIGLVVAHFYSMSNYSTRLNVDGTYHFSGTLVETQKVLFADRYKLVIHTEAEPDLTLPPLPSPREGDRELLSDLAPGACIDGDLTVKNGFLHDLSISFDDQRYHFDTDAGWLKVAEPEPTAPEEAGENLEIAPPEAEEGQDAPSPQPEGNEEPPPLAD